MADIGRLNAKITADPTGAVRDLAVAQRAFGTAAKGIESLKPIMQTGVSVNTKQALESAHAAVRQMEAVAPARLQLGADATRLRESIAAATKQANAIRPVAVPIRANASQVQQAVQQAQRHLGAIKPVVLPFRSDASQVQRAASEAQRQLQSIKPVTLPIRADASQVQRAAEEARKQLAGVPNKPSLSGAKPLAVPVTTDTVGLLRSLEAARRQVEATRPAKLQVTAELTGIGKLVSPAFREAQSDLKQLATQAAGLVKVNADPSMVLKLSAASQEATRSLRAAKQQLDILAGSMGRAAQVRLQADPSRVIRAAQQAKEAVERLKREVESSRPISFRGMLSRIGADLSASLKDLPKTLMGSLSGSNIGGAIGGLVGGGLGGGIGALLGSAGPWGAIAAGAFQAVQAVTALVAQTAMLVDETAKVSDRLGTTFEQFQAISHAAGLAGVSQDELNQAMTLFTRTMGNAARGDAGAVSAFARLGLDAQALARMAPDEALEHVSQAMTGLGTQADRTAAAMDLFGRNGARMMNFLEAAQVNISSARNELERMGFVLSRDQARQIEGMNDAFTRLQAGASAFARILAAHVAPTMRLLFDFATAAIGPLARSFAAWGSVVQALMTPLMVLYRVMLQVFRVIMALPTGLQIIAAVFRPIIQGMQFLMQIMDDLQPVFDAVVDAVSEIGNALLDLFNFSSWREFLSEVREKLLPAFRQLAASIATAARSAAVLIRLLKNPGGSIADAINWDQLQNIGQGFAQTGFVGAATNAWANPHPSTQPGQPGQSGVTQSQIDQNFQWLQNNLPTAVQQANQSFGDFVQSVQSGATQIPPAFQPLLQLLPLVQTGLQAASGAMNGLTAAQQQMAQQLNQQFSSPLHNMASSIQQIDGLFQHGAISQDVWARAMSGSIDQLRQSVGAVNQINLPRALEAGSSGAISAINQFRMESDLGGTPQERMANLLQRAVEQREQQLAYANEQARILRELLSQGINLGPAGI